MLSQTSQPIREEDLEERKTPALHRVIVKISEIRHIKLLIKEDSSLEDVKTQLLQRASDLKVENCVFLMEDTGFLLTDERLKGYFKSEEPDIPDLCVWLEERGELGAGNMATDVDDVNLLVSQRGIGQNSKSLKLKHKHELGPVKKAEKKYQKTTAPVDRRRLQRKQVSMVVDDDDEERNQRSSVKTETSTVSGQEGTSPWLIRASNKAIVFGVVYHLCLFVPALIVIFFCETDCEKPLTEWNYGALILSFLYLTFQVVFWARRGEFSAGTDFALRASYFYHFLTILSFVWYAVLGNLWAWVDSDCQDESKEALMTTRVIVSLNNLMILFTLVSLTVLCCSRRKQS